jgi:hypothetical protein
MTTPSGGISASAGPTLQLKPNSSLAVIRPAGAPVHNDAETPMTALVHGLTAERRGRMIVA